MKVIRKYLAHSPLTELTEPYVHDEVTMESAWQLAEVTKPEEGSCWWGGAARTRNPCFSLGPAPIPEGARACGVGLGLGGPHLGLFFV